MKFSAIYVKAIRIDDIPNLDPITVYIENYELGKGKIIIEIFGLVYSSYWGAMGKRNSIRFFVSCTDEYLVNCFKDFSVPENKEKDKFLLKIVKVIKKAFEQMIKSNWNDK